MTATDRLARAAIAAAIVGLVAWSCWQRWDVLSASPFPLGIDGYFYPIQLRSLLEHGTLQYPASPLAFWFMAPFAAATDPITGAKLGAAIGGALIAIPAYLLGARLGKSRGAGLLAAVLSTLSAGSAYLTIEFVKNGIGLTVALTAVWLALRANERPTRARVVTACCAAVAAVLTHKMAGIIAIGIAAPAAFAEARGCGALRGRRLLYTLGAGVAALVALLVAGAIAPQRVPSVHDLAQLGSLVSSTAHWGAPALLHPRLTLDHEALIGGLIALVAAAAMSRPGRRALAVSRTPSELVTAWIAIAIAIVIALPWLAVEDQQGLGFRLRIVAFVPMALCAAIVAGALAKPGRALVAAVIGERNARGYQTLLIAIAATVALRTPGEGGEGMIVAHPALVSGCLALAEQIPADATVIVPERHVEFMVAWYTRADVAARPESVPYARRVRVLLPLSSGTGDRALEHAVDAARREPSLVAPIGLHPRHRNGLVLVTEPTWNWIVDHLPPRARRRFAAWPTI